MAFLTGTDTQTSQEIEGSGILAALGFQFISSSFEVWSSTNLTYSLNIGQTPPGETAGSWSSGLVAAFTAALADIASVSGVDFTEVFSGADIDLWSYAAIDGALGYSYGIGGPGVFINENYTSSSDTTYGGYDYVTIIHELLHNMGLAHPHGSYASLPDVSNSGDTGDQ